MKIIKEMKKYVNDRNGFDEIPLSVWDTLNWKVYKKYSFWLYWQHSNWMFYLKKIWRLKSYVEEEWLFWKLWHYIVKLDSKYKWWLSSFYVCMFWIPYSESLWQQIPNEINPLSLKKWKRKMKIHNDEKARKQVNLFSNL